MNGISNANVNQSIGSNNNTNELPRKMIDFSIRDFSLCSLLTLFMKKISAATMKGNMAVLIQIMRLYNRRFDEFQ